MSLDSRLAIHRQRLDAAGYPYWWEEETTARQVHQFVTKSGNQSQSFPLTGDFKPGLNEVTIEYLTGEGVPTVMMAELVDSEGKVIASDAHPHTLTNDPRRTSQFYQLVVPAGATLKGAQLRVSYTADAGTCDVAVMLLPPLPVARYHSYTQPGGKTNASDQKHQTRSKL